MSAAVFARSGRAFNTVINRIKVSAFFSCMIFFWGVSPLLTIAYTGYFLYNGISSVGLGIMAMYAVWYAYSFHWPSSGGMIDNALSRYMRERWFLSRWAGEYLEHSIVKTAELPTDRNYLIGCHPHGFVGMGFNLCNSCQRRDFRDLFPGISQVATTLSGNFFWPLRREFAMLYGVLDCSKKSINYFLGHPDKGKAVCVLIGGLNEAIATTNGKFFLKMKGRKGFAKAALENGASLVPLFNFGENELFTDLAVKDMERLRNMQARLRTHVPFLPPMAVGRSTLGLPWGGALPNPGPVTSVVGAPIDVQKVEKPTQEQIDAVYDRYCASLVELFEEHKGNYGVPEKENLIFY